MKPRILLVSTCRWLSSARLATALVAVGCEVEAVCPSRHPVTRALAGLRTHAFGALHPLGSIRVAIAVCQPDLVVPCDDLATIYLHRLYEGAIRSGHGGAATCSLLERSLGSPSSFHIVDSRSRLIALAKKNGIRVPPTAVVRNLSDLKAWIRRQGLPVVLKADGTAGGRGVRVVSTLAEAKSALEELSAPLGPARAIKRALVNGDRNYLKQLLERTQAVVSAQGFVRGQDANSTVACWNGRVLATLTASVVETSEPYGPSSVIRLVKNAAISRAVERLVSRLKVSGLVGFDFMIEERTGHAYLIEMNARATQMGHIPLGSGRDLPASLRSAITGEPARERPSVTDNEVIAFFPQEWLRNAGSSYLTTAYHDVPWGQPNLVRASLEETPMYKMWTAASRTTRRLRAAIQTNLREFQISEE